MIKRAEAAGCPALVFTIDLLGGSNRLTGTRARRRDTQDCTSCHPKGFDDNSRKPMLAGLKPAPPAPETGPATWDFVSRLKDATPMKLVLKGIVTREDAEMAVSRGADVVYVSNHGGRAENSLRSAVECVPEVVAGVGKRVPVLVDSGFRRGTDIFKALALGAVGVGIGRPYIWGLAAFGQEGVETVLAILRRELQMVMRQAGTTAISAITPACLVDRKGPSAR
jgi:isopentenyl diphosphate isomerase/L-lactate dehydrogenase-like FMN-dependent dehydrogenase